MNLYNKFFETLFVFFTLTFALNSLSQSKKEQIIALNKRVDSLNAVLSATRYNSAKETTELTKEINVLKRNVTEIEKLKTEIDTLKSLNEQNMDLMQQNKELRDSLSRVEPNYFSAIQGNYLSHELDGSRFNSSDVGVSIHYVNNKGYLSAGWSVFGGIVEAEIIGIYKEKKSFRLILRGYFNNDSIVALRDDPLIDKKMYEVVIDKSDTNNIKFLGFPTTHVDFRNYTFYFEE
ncbi:hypothetical protein N8017_02990 [Crocinitomicaceae bacterium]|nr:hypothetical protein [Crocinitomicaceae bacterium]